MTPFINSILERIYTAKVRSGGMPEHENVYFLEKESTPDERRILKKMGYVLTPQEKISPEAPSMIIITWPYEEIVSRRFDVPDPKNTTVDPSDVEKHGFVMEPRTDKVAPFVFTKMIMVDENGVHGSWEDYGYVCQLTMFMPSGHTFIHIYSPEDFFIEKYKKDPSGQDCLLSAMVRTPEELDMIIKMTLQRDPSIKFSPEEPVPHKNFWVDLALRIRNTRPAIN